MPRPAIQWEGLDECFKLVVVPLSFEKVIVLAVHGLVVSSGVFHCNARSFKGGFVSTRNGPAVNTNLFKHLSKGILARLLTLYI